MPATSRSAFRHGRRGLTTLFLYPDNHKPTLSSAEAPDRARIKPSVPGKTTSYDLTYTDDDESYAFTGTRSTDDDQYVLYFDPARQVFVLDKVDSTFNMNLTRMPGSSDADELSRRFPHLEVDPVKDSINVKGPAQSSKPSLASKTASAPAKRKIEKQPPKSLAMPAAAPPTSAPKPKPKKRDEEEEEEEDEEDDILAVEYPEGPSNFAKQNDFSPAFPTQRRFDEYMNQRESEADDADGESDDEIDMDFKLPSPVNNKQNGDADEEEHDEAAEEDENDDDGAAIDLEGDLEDALANAFEDLANSQEEGRDDESEISEED